MDAIDFFKERKRMCQFYFNTASGCSACGANSEDSGCLVLPIKTGAVSDFVQAIKIVESWSKSHPKKTRKEDFLEKYPNAKINKDGLPEACCEDLGYGNCEFSFIDKCTECWNKNMED